MKNTRGVTLMETIVAIMILSIAGFMLFSGFSTVMKTMSRSAMIKNDSDALLSYAEKTDDNTINEKVEEKQGTFSYTIKNQKGTSVNVSNTLKTLQIKNSDLIQLQLIEGEDVVINSIKNTEEYKSLINNVDSFIDEVENAVEAYPEVYRDFLGNNATPYFKDFDQNDYVIFDKNLLPDSLKNIASETSPFYVKCSYPWEFSRPDNIHGGLFVYLSQSNSKNVEGANSEPFRVVYDYENKQWFFYTGGNCYLDHQPSTKNENNAGHSTNIYYNGSYGEYKSWKEFISHIRSSSDWQIMNVNASIDSGDIWQNK